MQITMLSDTDKAWVRERTELLFSGTFLVRTSPSLHARLAVEAADQHVSMNHWIVQKLADRPPSSLLDW